MSNPEDLECLQCRQTKEEVKNNGTFCATVDGYEYREVIDEWPRHHWRDWSNAELKRFGIHPSLWEANRRTHIYNLEWPILASHCMERGHTYPKPWHPPMHPDRRDIFPPHICVVCHRSANEILLEES